jgi:hypothetical protein
VILAGLVVWQFCFAIFRASRRNFVYDELCTVHLSSLWPAAGTIWKALESGADSMPPGFYLFVIPARLIPADLHITLRLWSILGYIFCMIGVYMFVRKRLSTHPALIAVLLLCSSSFRMYALQARSYALMVGCLAVAAAVWQELDEKRWAAPAMAALLAGAVACHYLAVLTLGCFGVAEIVYAAVHRRIRYRSWLAMAFGAVPFAVYVPLILNFRAVFGNHFWSKAGAGLILPSYTDYLGLPIGVTLILLCGILLSLVHRSQRWRQHGYELPELVLIAALILYPVAVISIAMLQHGGYTARYGLPAIVGLVWGLAAMLPRGWSTPRSVSVPVAALLLALAGRDFLELRELGPAPIGTHAAWPALAEISGREPGLPLVIGSGMTHLELEYYGPPALRRRSLQLIDEEQAIRLQGTDSVDRLNRILRRFYSFPAEETVPFLNAHPTFLLQSTRRGYCWITAYLLERGYRLTVLWEGGDSSIYRVEKV